MSRFTRSAALLLLACLFATGCAPRQIEVSDSVQVSAQETTEQIPNEEEDMDNDNNLRITIRDNGFVVDGKPIWMNGVNTPWNKWNDFGGGYDDAWWDSHFAKLHEEGINAVRVWINCNNDQRAVDIDADGFVHGVSEKHWTDLDLFFATAERNRIYIMATFISFDHFKDTGSRPEAESWRNMLKSDEAVDSYIEHYTKPFLSRYGNNPYLWSIDLCNEPDWIHENSECGNMAWTDISRFFARNAAAIHENSDILVTVGMGFPKYNADGAGCAGNKVSDTFLQNLYPNENAYLDFWSPHYYDWVGEWYGVPFYVSPFGKAPEGWRLDASKPAMIGECLAKGSANNTIVTDYEQAYLNGWQGVMPWTSNGVDSCGNLDDLSPGTRHMLDNYGELIFPLNDYQ